jgi:hypothetical protein
MLAQLAAELAAPLLTTEQEHDILFGNLPVETNLERPAADRPTLVGTGNVVEF